MGKILGALIAIALVVALLLFGGNYLFGDGSGTGEASELSTATDSTELNETNEEEKSEDLNNAIIIEVNKDEYIVDGEVLSITKIESMLSEDNGDNYVIQDNYGSAKSWDDLKALFLKYGIDFIED